MPTSAFFATAVFTRSEIAGVARQDAEVDEVTLAAKPPHVQMAARCGDLLPGNGEQAGTSMASRW
jgi:hypothetical protein